jgi:hypothetical protein
MHQRMMGIGETSSNENLLTVVSLLESTHHDLNFEERRDLRNLFVNVLMNLLSGFKIGQLSRSEKLLASSIIAYFERSTKSGIIAFGNWFEMGLEKELYGCRVEAELKAKAIHKTSSPCDWTLQSKKDRENRVHRYTAAEAEAAVSNLSASSQLLDAIAHAGGQEIVPTGKNIYLFYDGENSGVDPHIDRDEYEVNVLTVLEHSKTDRSTSSFMTVGADLNIQKREMRIGDWIAFYGGGTVHGRSNCSFGERLVVLSMGFSVTL